MFIPTKEAIDQIHSLRMFGGSVKSIAKELGISKATVSKYCKNLRPNNPFHSIGQEKASKQRAADLAEQRQEIRSKAKEEWPSIRENKSMLSLIAFYWSEGTKRCLDHKTAKFAITNSDPGILAICKKTLEGLGYIPQLRLYLRKEHDRGLCIRKWTQFIGIAPVGVHIRTSQNRRIYSQYGVAVLEVLQSRRLWLSIMEWIECWRLEMGISESCQLSGAVSEDRTHSSCLGSRRATIDTLTA
jgi:predicted transcriptional regulator